MIVPVNSARELRERIAAEPDALVRIGLFDVRPSQIAALLPDTLGIELATGTRLTLPAGAEGLFRILRDALPVLDLGTFDPGSTAKLAVVEKSAGSSSSVVATVNIVSVKAEFSVPNYSGSGYSVILRRMHLAVDGVKVPFTSGTGTNLQNVDLLAAGTGVANSSTNVAPKSAIFSCNFTINAEREIAFTYGYDPQYGEISAVKIWFTLADGNRLYTTCDHALPASSSTDLVHTVVPSNMIGLGPA